ncbi:imm11 family protein [Paenibacillus apiarius]|uniref:imm11 family protein n=1 Tax=Paenibacillus apiarius TaxID=46240 RepID=UPI003B3B0F07
MRDYYLILDDDRIGRKVKPLGFRRDVGFEHLPAISVLDVKEEENGPGEYVDWLEKPMRMMSDRMKAIMEKYNRELRVKRVDLIDMKYNLQHEYWVMQVPEVDCLSLESEFHRNGMLKRLVLDKDRVKGHHFFAIQGIAEPYLVASLEAVESLLRRGLTGFMLRKVEQLERGAT